MIWHITHRCHKREFLLKFASDRRRWLHWLYESKNRYDLTILNYTVTSNHIHLLIIDETDGNVAKAIQPAAGRTAREYNIRKKRKGAFWEDRYHATAVDGGKYLRRCLVYIDRNMVRAGAVEHPAQRVESGFNEIRCPPKRYRLIDRKKLANSLRLANDRDLAASHEAWIEEALLASRDKADAVNHFSKKVAVGSVEFVHNVGKQLGYSLKERVKRIESESDTFSLRESGGIYRKRT